MKTIPNKTISVKVPTKEGIKTVQKKYSELIVECVNNPPKEGFTIKDMQQCLRIVEVAEKANGEITIEDADADKLKNCIQQMRWLFLSPEIVAFSETITNI